MRKVFVLLLLVPFYGFSQFKSEPFGVALDYQFLSHRNFSIGIGYMTYEKENGKKEGWRIDLEFSPKNNSLVNNIYGVKLDGYLVYKKFFNLGYGFGGMTDFSGYKVNFIPEFGIGYKSLFIVYRRNIKLFGNELTQLNKDNLSIRFYIPLDRDWFKVKSN